MLRVLCHGIVFAVLTLLTQIGGIAWLIATLTRRKLVAFIAAYAVLSGVAYLGAPAFGRVPLPCLSEGPLKMQSWVYCALNRHYVTPKMAVVAQDLANHMDRQFPGTVTLALDANFPFIDGFPLLPHISHDDGRKLDLAFWYRNETEYLAGQTRSPLGYFAFEPGPTECPDRWPTLRWDFEWLQVVWPDWKPDEVRMRAAMAWLGRDGRVRKMFLEPHLARSLRVQHRKVRFQGCRAARHDDHIHIQL